MSDALYDHEPKVRPPWQLHGIIPDPGPTGNLPQRSPEGTDTRREATPPAHLYWRWANDNDNRPMNAARPIPSRGIILVGLIGIIGAIMGLLVIGYGAVIDGPIVLAVGFFILGLAIIGIRVAMDRMGLYLNGGRAR